MKLKSHLEEVKKILTELGEDPSREGLNKTPQRFLETLEELTSGYRVDIAQALEGGLFNETGSGMVTIRSVEFYSLCEHHLVPFYGVCHVGYLPNKKIIGLSKIPKIIEIFSKRLQVQERLTHQIGEELVKILAPKGLGVVMEAYHLCMMMRGIQKQKAVAITSYMDGAFLNSETREEFMSHVRLQSV